MASERLRRLIDPAAIVLALVVGLIQIGLTTFAAYRGWGPPDPGPGPGGPWEPHPGWSPGPGRGPGRSEGPWSNPDFNLNRTPPGVLGYLLLAAGPVALAVRRRFPTPVLLVAAASIIGYLVLGYSTGPVLLAAIVAMVSAVWHGARPAAWLIGLGGLATYWVLELLFGRDPPPTWNGIISSVAWTLVFLLVAEAIRFRRERLASARQARAQEARRIADEERLRIARELHDVLAHNISMINVQASVALHLADQLPDQARNALQAIKDASRETLREVRGTLGVLRRVDEDAPRAPAPGLARLDDLLSRTGSAGLDVRKETTGEPRPLPAGTDLAAYRIIQEALTNVHRHAGATTAWVRLEYTPDTLVVRVEDDGVGDAAADDGRGAGISGMTERAAALGGTLSAGPGPGGGFQVRATLPAAD